MVDVCRSLLYICHWESCEEYWSLGTDTTHVPLSGIGSTIITEGSISVSCSNRSLYVPVPNICTVKASHGSGADDGKLEVSYQLSCWEIRNFSFRLWENCVLFSFQAVVAVDGPCFVQMLVFSAARLALYAVVFATSRVSTLDYPPSLDLITVRNAEHKQEISC